MNQIEILKDFVAISKYAGDIPAYVQGGGGNTSVKLDDKRMAIKASGYLLSDMTTDSGYSVVNYSAIREYLKSPDTDEDIFTTKIQSFIVETNNRPSIETGFHALLSKYVIHTHSVFANLLSCSTEGKNIALKLFPNAMWVEYANPGRELTTAVTKAIQKHDKQPEIVFLQNHGVIVSANNANVAQNTHESLNAIIKEHLNVSKEFNPTDVATDIEYLQEHVLFPDQVVYTLAGEEILSTKAAKETLAAYKYIWETIEAKGLIPSFIPETKRDELSNMEAEKFRQKVIKK